MSDLPERTRAALAPEGPLAAHLPGYVVREGIATAKPLGDIARDIAARVAKPRR